MHRVSRKYESGHGRAALNSTIFSAALFSVSMPNEEISARGSLEEAARFHAIICGDRGKAAFHRVTGRTTINPQKLKVIENL